MGGSSSSSSSARTTTTTTTANVALEDLENPQVVTNSTLENVTLTDYGAVGEAFDFADSVNARSADAFEQALGASSAAVSTVERLAKQAASGSQTVIADTLKSIFQPAAWGLLAVAGLWGLYQWRSS